MKKARGRIRVAAVDAGSNATRLLLGECGDDGAFVEEMFLRVPLRLGGGDVVWQAAKIDKLAKVLRAYHLLIQTAAPDKWQAVATAALRRCQNRDEVLAIVKRKSGINLRVLTGREEAQLSGHFAASMFAGRAVLNMDTGGGSTDCAIVKDGEVLAAESFVVGTAQSKTGENTKAKKQMQRWLQQQTTMHKNIVLTGSGGSVRVLETMCGGNITKKSLTKLLPMVAKMTPMMRAKQFNLTADRAESVVPAMRIYLCALQATTAPKLRAIEGGLCQALITNTATRHFASSK